MNATAARAFPATRTSPRRADFPVGSVIVKEKALTDSAKTKLAVAGMIKRAPGYDPAAGDWEFFYVEPGGPIDQGPIETCRACHGGAAPRDRVRDRRLEPGEEARIRGVMAGEKREDRERALEMPEREALQLLFTLALETAMRMSEMYTLTVDQVMLSKRSIALERTKNGDSRQVPLSSVAMDALREWLERGGRSLPGQVFPWFNPEAPVRDQERRRVTTRLSQQFQRIFAYAGITDLTFHDLRHEATCRLYERTKFSDIQIARVTGHKDPRMLLRYASLRGSDLAAGMW
jgi:integrase